MPTPIPSTDVQDFLENVKDFDVLCNDAGNYTDRFGKSRLTVDAFFRSNGFEVPVAFASGIVVGRTTQTVTYGGNTYHALPTAIPFTTTGTFNSAQWALLRQNADNVTSATLTISGFAASALLDGAWIHFAGRDAVGDGGGGFLRYDADSTATANGVTIYAPAGGGRLFRDADGVFPASVRWAGNPGDPAAIAAALSASGNKPILLDQGKFGSYVNDPSHPAHEVRLIGGAIRRESGAWSAIDDSGHDPIGITSCEEIDAYTLRVHFNGDNTTVGTILAAVDKELAPYAIIGGASCSTNYADFSFFAPVIVDLQNKTTPSVAPWLSSYVNLNTSGVYSTVINHPPRALNVDPPGVSLINRAAGSSRVPAISWTPTTTTITATGELGAIVQRTSSGVFSVSNQTAGVSISASWASGGLTISHPDCGNGSIPVVTSFNSAYRAEVASFSASQIVVQFRNASGAIVGPVDDAEMNLMFTRTNSLFDVAMPSSFSARVDLGYLQIPLAAIQNISLNNFWIVGAMFKYLS